MQTVPTFNVLNGDAIEGPYTAGQLRVLEERGTIGAQTPVAREGEAEWLPLEVWREVIHGAPTHRGPIPGGIRKRVATGDAAEDATNGLVKAALILALAGIAMLVGGQWLEGDSGWMTGVGTLGVALVLWVAGARR